jgi:rhodanese-related sulfurtransferase
MNPRAMLSRPALGLAVLLEQFARRMRTVRRGVASDEGVSWIEANDLADRLDRESAPITLDVRGPDEFRGALGHLRNARNMPLDELPSHVSELAEFRERDLVLVCRTQMRSAKAAALLSNAGFSGAHVLRGGMEQWNRLGLPVEGRSTPTAPAGEAE